MVSFVTILFAISLWAPGYSQKEATSISKFIAQSTIQLLLETIWRQEEMVTNFIERTFNTTILPREDTEGTNNDIIDLIGELKDGIANLKDLTLYISDKNDAKEVFGEIETALRTISDTFEKTVIAKGHFANNIVEMPSMYEYRFRNALHTCATSFESLYNTIIDKKLLFEYALPGFNSSLKLLEDVCKIEKSQNMELANVIGIIKTAVAQMYVSLNITSALADQFRKNDGIGSYAASFHIEWYNIKLKYKKLIMKLKSDMKNSSTVYWSCKPPKTDQHVRFKQQQSYYINIQPSESDWRNNSVAIGAKFELVGDTFILRVLEGQLLPNGSINPKTIRWENNTRNPEKRVQIIKTHKYYKAFDLTEVKLPPGHLVVSLEMAWIKGHGDGPNNRIGLLAYSAGYDFEKGKIRENDDILRRRLPPTAREKLLLYKKDQKDKIFTKGNQYVLIDETNEKNEKNDEISRDNKKQIIPLLSIEEVETKPEIPLSGAGLYLHRVSPVENMIGIKLFNYDFSPHISTHIS